MSATTLKHSRFVSASPIHYGWVVWLVATIGWIATTPAQSFNLSLFFDYFIQDFGLSRTMVSTLFGIGTFIASLSLTYVGRGIDRYGNRAMGVFLAACFTVSIWLFPRANGAVGLLLGFIALRSFGQGALSLVNTTVIAEWFKRLRGRMMSLSLLAFALFQAAYVPYVQQQIELHGWRQIWVFLAIGVAVTVIPLTWLLMRDRPEQYGLLPDALDLRRSQSMIIPKEANWSLPEAKKMPIFWVFLLGRIVSPAWGSGLIIHQVSLFTVLGHNARIAAETFAMVTLITAFSSLAFGWLVDRIRPTWVMAIQMIALSVALLVASFMQSYELRVVYAIAFGIVMGGGAVFDGAVWANVFGRKHQGSIRGFVTTITIASTAFGPILFGWDYDSFGGYQLVLGAGLLLSVIVVVASFIVRVPQVRSE